MAIGSVNYPSPVNVNGFACRNCSEVDFAKKGIDPAHPQSGPHNRDAAVDSSRRDIDPVKLEALRRAARDPMAPVTQYGPAGRIGGAIPTGSAVSLLA